MFHSLNHEEKVSDRPPPDEPDEVISIRHLWAGYNHEPVLEDINLSVRELDFIGLIGPNGSGKTTLFKVLLGLLSPMRGDVRIMGKSVQKGRRYMGYVPQMVEFDQDFPISVWDVVMLGRLEQRRLLQPFTPKDARIVEVALRSVDMLHWRDRSISDLSGGQRKRVYIARALATEPRILLLDEPLAGIDPQMGSHVYELLQHLNRTITILMISHDIGAIASCVKTIGCLNRRLYYHGETSHGTRALPPPLPTLMRNGCHDRSPPVRLYAECPDGGGAGQHCLWGDRYVCGDQPHCLYQWGHRPRSLRWHRSGLFLPVQPDPGGDRVQRGRSPGDGLGGTADAGAIKPT
jgi:zinc transport system ATP-binding protein